jgi:hypothetical protein
VVSDEKHHMISIPEFEEAREGSDLELFDKATKEMKAQGYSLEGADYGAPKDKVVPELDSVFFHDFAKTVTEMIRATPLDSYWSYRTAEVMLDLKDFYSEISQEQRDSLQMAERQKAVDKKQEEESQNQSEGSSIESESLLFNQKNAECDINSSEKTKSKTETILCYLEAFRLSDTYKEPESLSGIADLGYKLQNMGASAEAERVYSGLLKNLESMDPKAGVNPDQALYDMGHRFADFVVGQKSKDCTQAVMKSLKWVAKVKVPIIQDLMALAVAKKYGEIDDPH